MMTSSGVFFRQDGIQIANKQIPEHQLELNTCACNSSSLNMQIGNNQPC